jgi:hypothetical protein
MFQLGKVRKGPVFRIKNTRNNPSYFSPLSTSQNDFCKHIFMCPFLFLRVVELECAI